MLGACVSPPNAYFCAHSREPAQLQGVNPGGSLLAEKLVDIYFTTFRLILEGRVGQKVQQARSQTAKLPPDKRAKADKAAAKAKEAGTDPKQVLSLTSARVHKMKVQQRML